MEAKQQQQQEDATTTKTDEQVTQSNAASVVGRQICILPKNNSNHSTADGLSEAGRKGVIVAYDPVSRQHTVRYFLDGSSSSSSSDKKTETTTTNKEEEESLVLNQHRFRWIVKPAEEASKDNWKERMERAVKQDAVGRRLKIWSKKLEKWFDGTIVAYDADSDKHRIKFDLVKTLRRVRIEDEKWTYTDFVGERASSARSCSLKMSRFMGVSRQSESAWTAYKGPMIPERRIGTFASERDAALAHDVFARKDGRPVNFPNESITETEMENRRSLRPGEPNPVKGKSKFRGVQWSKNRQRWMARYTLQHKGQKNINLGTFLDSKHAALAFDAEARRRGRADSDLNFPDERPTNEQIENWKTSTSQYSMMGSQKQATSQYRGVSRDKNNSKYQVQINFNNVVQALGRKKGPISGGYFDSEVEAALVYDRICRRHGVPEKELNFPRNMPLAEVRLFDRECYLCFSNEPPADPVATRCNHIFCRKCIIDWLHLHKHCPCCSTQLAAESKDLRSVKLVVPNSLVISNQEKTHDSDADDEADNEAKSGSHNVAPAAADDDDRNNDNNQARMADSTERNDDDTKPAAHQQLVESEAASLGRLCRYPVGTRIMKEFEGQGTFEGHVTSYDGEHYRVHYPADDDEEELSEHEFDDLEITFRPGATAAKLADGDATKVSTDNDDGAASTPQDKQQSPRANVPLTASKIDPRSLKKAEPTYGTSHSDALPTTSKVHVVPSSPKEAAAPFGSEKSGVVGTESELQSRSKVTRSKKTEERADETPRSTASKLDSLSKVDPLPEQPRNGAASDCENHKVGGFGSESLPGSEVGETITADTSPSSSTTDPLSLRSHKVGSEVQSYSETVSPKKVKKDVDKNQKAASYDHIAVETTRPQDDPDCPGVQKLEDGVAGIALPETARNRKKGRKRSGPVDESHVESEESLVPVKCTAAASLSESITRKVSVKHLTGKDNTSSGESSEDAEVLTMSNSASVVGRQISIYSGKAGILARDAVIVAYNPRTNEHTVRFDDDGKEVNFALTEQRFQWKVEPANAALDKNDRLRRAVMRGAVGRRLKFLNEKTGKWFEGTIVGLNEKKDKHRIQFDVGKQVKSFRLENETWQYTDFIGTRAPNATNCSLSCSKYMGVTRTGVSQWVAYEDPLCRGRSMGTFAREKDAALAHDAFAQKNGQQVNFKDEKEAEDSVEQQKKAREEKRATLLESQGASKRPPDEKAEDGEGTNGKSSSLEQSAVHDTANASTKSGNTEQQSASRRKAASQHRGVISDKKDAKTSKSRRRKGAATASKAVLTPRYPIGTRFTKEFKGVGKFDGEVKHFDGKYYKVHYPADGDEEDLSENELDNLTITFKPAVLPVKDEKDTSCGDNGEPSLSERPRSGKSSKNLKRDRTISISKEMSKRDKTVTSKQKKHASTGALAHDGRSDTVGVERFDKSKPEECALLKTENVTTGTGQAQRSTTGDLAQCVPATDHAGPRIALGTRFLKEFEGAGKYEGKVMSFDGDHYKVHYAEDGDEEEMSEWEFDDLEITHTPSSNVQPDSAKFNKEGAVEQSSAAKTESSRKKRKLDRKKAGAVSRVNEKALLGKKSSSSQKLHGAVIEEKGTETRPKDSARENKTKSAKQIQVDDEKVETEISQNKKKQNSAGDTGPEEAIPYHPEANNKAEASAEEEEPAPLSQKGAPSRQTTGVPIDVNADSSSSGAHLSEPSARPRLPIGTCFVKEFTGHGLLEGRVIGFEGPHYRVCYEEIICETDMQSFELIHTPRPELKRGREESADDETPKGKNKSTKKAKQGDATRKHKKK